jgi:hypothetical protein
MKYLMLLMGSLLSFISNAQTPTWAWANGAGTTNSDNGSSIAIDVNGDIYIAGSFNGAPITFGSTTLTNSGNTDIFIVKYSAAGAVLWATAVGGSGAESASGIALDAAGNVYITGSFASASLVFGSSTLTNAGSLDIFIAKFNSSGVAAWAVSAGGTGAESGNGIAVDGSANIYLTGQFGSPSLSIGSTTLTNGGGNDIFIAKYNSSGTAVWATSAGGTGTDQGRAVTTDASGNCYVSGKFNLTATFGSTSLTNGGLFVVKFSSAGIAQWAASASATGSQSDGLALAEDGSGNVIVTGVFLGATAVFGSTTLTNPAGSNTLGDIFVVKYNATGALTWAIQVGGWFDDYGKGIKTDASGNFYITGYTATANALTFGPSTVTNAAFFVAKGTPSGAFSWGVGVNGTGLSNGIALDATGSAFIVGNFNAGATFGTTSLTGVGGNDVFLAKLGQGCTSAPIQPVSITGSTAVCLGSSQTYSVPAVTGATSYAWTVPSGWTGTSTTNSISATVGVAGGTISVAAVNACGTGSAQTLTVGIASGPPATITAAGATAFCPGGSVMLNANTGAGLTYQWQLNGSNIPGATTPSYIANAAGSYTVIVTSSSCASMSAATTVTVSSLPSPTISQSGNVLTAPLGFASYKWYKNGTLIIPATAPTYTATSSGSYYVIVTNVNNCSGQSNTIGLTVGINDISASSVQFYPNPNEGRFYIDLSGSAKLQGVKAYNLLGQEVSIKATSINAGKLSVEITNKQPGLYYLQLTFPGEVINTSVQVR